ncbi:hypothetical protein F5J12DRAFT_44887 [Pisolithus orientalis]|uniref:uncharacterized protein n=1 Tax=Pisolithus orientalis TaxID=936130 RepID=UPI002224870C|nr:uncharacterized protein F5J12DRAFT_44887 [Pisolithus orientalis]KAI6009635.1 hypothetical protein F5J12DRAFT_44887 [Pisolithus orientalis]
MGVNRTCAGVCGIYILEEVNETIRDQESRARVSEVSNQLRMGKGRLDLTLPNHRLGPRKLLKKGALTKAKWRRKLGVLLWSDVLLLFNENGSGGLHRVPLLVHELEIHPSRNHTRPNDAHIRIHHAYLRCREALVPRASNIRKARTWTEAISGNCEDKGGDQGGRR